MSKRIRLIRGDCLEVLKTLPSALADAIVTDPPSGIGFMNKEWDDFRRARNPADTSRKNVFGRTSAKGPEYGRRPRDLFIAFLTEVMTEAFRVAKPGARALVWAIPRTSHWTATAIEDAGWVVEDRIAFLFGSGFPKHGSKLKPACEDWWVCWKPDKRATPLNIDRCRIGNESRTYDLKGGENLNRISRPNGNDSADAKGCGAYGVGARQISIGKKTATGRWPANVVLDEAAARMLDKQSGKSRSAGVQPARLANYKNKIYGNGMGGCESEKNRHGDFGGSSRFFYTSKASKQDRGKGNDHPTVKSYELMKWLCRLITPKGGTILDPFMGSGSTAKAAIAEGFRFIGIERDSGYHGIAERRVRHAKADYQLEQRSPPISEEKYAQACQRTIRRTCKGNGNGKA